MKITNAFLKKPGIAKVSGFLLSGNTTEDTFKK